MFNFKYYFNLLENEKLNEAITFKNTHIPKTLFKFVSLTESTCESDSKSQEKIDMIKGNKLWLSKYYTLNDPFELQSFYINEEKFKDKGFHLEYIHKFIDAHKDFFIGSFTTKCLDNLPMWAHYANNHKGICLEYEINRNNLFYPISYESKRFPANTILMNYFALSYKKALNSMLTKKEIEELNFYRMLTLHFNAIKHSSWKYEDEYRLLIPPLSEDNQVDGMLFDTKILGIKLKKIYVGLDCDEYYKEQLVTIAKNQNIKISQIIFDNSTENYELDTEEII